MGIAGLPKHLPTAGRKEILLNPWPINLTTGFLLLEITNFKGGREK